MQLLHAEIDIQLIRQWFTDRSSVGELFFPAKSAARECYILEDVARAPDVKIPKITCIPAGDYWIKITYSPHFKRLLPLIYNEDYYKDPVSGEEFYDLIHFGPVIFTGVRIHVGNVDSDTDACQLPGLSKSADNFHVWESEKAFDPADGSEGLYDKIFKQIGETGKLRYRIIHKQA